MRCPGCRSTAVRHRSERTAQGYRRYRCGDCGKQFNERSAGLLNRAQYPSDVIALVVLWRLRYKLSLRDLAEMFLIRGLVFSYEAVRDWEAKLTPALAENLRRRRKGKVGRSWYVDETYIRVRGHWQYLYRAIDRNGALVDVMLSERRDLAAAKAFFRSAKAVTGVTPDRVTTDGHDAYPRAIRTELGRHDSIPVNPGILRKFLSRRSPNFICKLLTHFHGKVIWWHGFGAYVGSANLTDAAWYRNIEAGCFFDETEMVASAMDVELREFFHRVDEHASPLSDELFRAIETRAQQLQRLAEQDQEQRQRFMGTSSIHQWRGLLQETHNTAIGRQRAAFVSEWYDTLQHLRG